MGGFGARRTDDATLKFKYSAAAGKVAVAATVYITNRAGMAAKNDGSRRQLSHPMEATRAFHFDVDTGRFTLNACQRPRVQRATFENQGSKGGRLVPDKGAISEHAPGAATQLTADVDARDRARFVAALDKMCALCGNEFSNLQRDAAPPAEAMWQPTDALVPEGAYSWRVRMRTAGRERTATLRAVHETMKRLRAWKSDGEVPGMFRPFCPVSAERCTLHRSHSFPRFRGEQTGRLRDTGTLPPAGPGTSGTPGWYHCSLGRFFLDRPETEGYRKLVQKAEAKAEADSRPPATAPSKAKAKAKAKPRGKGKGKAKAKPKPKAKPKAKRAVASASAEPRTLFRARGKKRSAADMEGVDEVDIFSNTN